MKALRIIFCILACLCVAGAVPAAVFLGWYALLFILGAVVFGVIMVIIKRATDPKYVMTDFMNTDEQNAEIIRKRNEHDE